jgi:hypothetical protein
MFASHALWSKFIVNLFLRHYVTKFTTSIIYLRFMEQANINIITLLHFSVQLRSTF